MTVPVELKDLVLYGVIVFNLFMNIKMDLKISKVMLNISGKYAKQDDFKACQERCRQEHIRIYDKIEGK